MENLYFYDIICLNNQSKMKTKHKIEICRKFVITSNNSTTSNQDLSSIKNDIFGMSRNKFV